MAPRAHWSRRIGVVLVLVLALPLSIELYFARRIVKARRQPPGPGPSARGLPFEDVGLETEEGLRLAAWFIPAPGARAPVLLVHGHNAAREDLLDRASVLHAAGHPAFLLDLRAHGDSEGDFCTLGVLERLDVRVAARWLALRTGRRPGAWGISMGAVSVLLAAASSPGEPPAPELAGIVAESPFCSVRETVAHHAGLWYGMPEWPLVPGALALAEWAAGFDASLGDAAAALSRLEETPVLIVQSERDVRVPEWMRRRLLDAARGPVQSWTCPEATHGKAWTRDRESYARRVLAFFGQDEPAS